MTDASAVRLTSGLVVLPDTASEMLFWEQLTSYYKQVLLHPWRISLVQQQELREQESQASRQRSRTSARSRGQDDVGKLKPPGSSKQGGCSEQNKHSAKVSRAP